ncbi:MAG: Rrf2 family transcriptional regulator [Acidobacteria bacterium]|nr:Rrf2 family transcriptional regulator [Acidobacteriota bacterium]
MKISAHEEYGIRCLAQVARRGGKVTIAEIADAEHLSVENAAKILARLRTLGLVRSIRGKDGGYVMARPADQVSVAEVLEGMTGGLFELERCVTAGEGAGCVHQSACELRPVWTTLGDLVHWFLGSITLADVINAGEGAVQARVSRLAEAIAAGSGLPLTRRLPTFIERA